MQSRTVPVVAAVAAVALLATAATAGTASTPLPGNHFQVNVEQLYLDAATGPAGKLLSPQAPASQSTTNFLAPGVSVLGIVNTPATDSWTTTTPWDKDTEVVDATQAVLYFSANAQATTVFQVRLFDVQPDGLQHLVAQDDQQFVTALSPIPITFDLHAQGAILHKGNTLKLEVFAQTANVLVVLSYGGATPSGLHDLKVRWLDSDGDGVADSDEIASGSNPLDPTDQRAVGGLDSDGDGCSDAFEKAVGTDPHKFDTDGDGYGDCLEIHAGSNPLDPNSKPYDKNGNGLPDSFETRYFNSTMIQSGAADPLADPDGDGCNNLCEAAHGTDPTKADTDGDGVSDGAEIAAGTNPLGADPPRVAVLRGVPEPVASSAFFATGSTLALVALLRRP